MNKLVLIFFCLVFANSVFSQRKLGLGGGVGLPQRGADNGQFSRDSLSGKPSRKSVKNDEAKIQDYLIIRLKALKMGANIIKYAFEN